MSGIIDPDTRVSRSEVPSMDASKFPNPGQIPSLGLNVLGVTSFNSNVLNEVQHEATQFGLLSLQKHLGDIDVQISAFVPQQRSVLQPGRCRRPSL